MRARLSTLVRYALVSATAMVLDVSATLALMSVGLWPAAAAFAGYLFGIAAHWAMSVHLVFAREVAPRGALRARQAGLFAASAAIGLFVTVAVVALTVERGATPLVAKIEAILASFILVYALRRYLIFQRAAAPA